MICVHVFSKTLFILHDFFRFQTNQTVTAISSAKKTQEERCWNSSQSLAVRPLCDLFAPLTSTAKVWKRQGVVLGRLLLQCSNFRPKLLYLDIRKYDSPIVASLLQEMVHIEPLLTPWLTLEEHSNERTTYLILKHGQRNGTKRTVSWCTYRAPNSKKPW